MQKGRKRPAERHHWLHRLYRWNLLEYVCGALLVALTLVCFFQVVGRYFLLTQGIGWAEEFSRLFFVWGVFLGAVVAVKRDAHLGVDLIIKRLPEGGRPWAAIVLFKHLCMLVISLILLYYGVEFSRSTAADHMTTLGYSRNLFYIPAPISGFLMILYLIPRIVRDIGVLLGVITTTRDSERRDLLWS